jgi:hypothetical protein
VPTWDRRQFLAHSAGVIATAGALRASAANASPNMPNSTLAPEWLAENVLHPVEVSGPDAEAIVGPLPGSRHLYMLPEGKGESHRLGGFTVTRMARCRGTCTAAAIRSFTLPADSAESKLVGAALKTVPERVLAASPLNYLCDQAPPFLIMHGLADSSVPHHQSIMLYQALSGLGKDVTLRLVDGLPHGFMNVSDIDTVAGPFTMQVRRHRDSGVTEWAGIETASIFDVAREFFRRHLTGA